MNLMALAQLDAQTLVGLYIIAMAGMMVRWFVPFLFNLLAPVTKATLEVLFTTILIFLVANVIGSLVLDDTEPAYLAGEATVKRLEKRLNNPEFRAHLEREQEQLRMEYELQQKSPQNPNAFSSD